jgi:SAM-dependent methyltransferase
VADQSLPIPARFHELAEAHHELQNPTSTDKIRLLGERLGLTHDSHVLDVASGRGGPALVLAEEFGCRITGVELRATFLEAAEEHARRRGLDSRVRFVHADAREFELAAAEYDAALCLGASFVWGGLEPTVAALAPTVPPGGYVAVGEPYWRTWPLPPRYPDPEVVSWRPLDETVAAFEQAGLRPAALIASSEDDWDRYESLHWQTLEEWLAAHPEDPDAEAVRRAHVAFRDRYLSWDRAALGWAILVGRS